MATVAAAAVAAAAAAWWGMMHPTAQRAALGCRHKPCCCRREPRARPVPIVQNLQLLLSSLLPVGQVGTSCDAAFMAACRSPSQAPQAGAWQHALLLHAAAIGGKSNCDSFCRSLCVPRCGGNHGLRRRVQPFRQGPCSNDTTSHQAAIDLQSTACGGGPALTHMWLNRTQQH